jgi:hypothetical protein
MRQVLSFRCFALLLGLLLLLPGCGPAKGAKFEGTIVKGGQPFSLPEGATLHLGFRGKGLKGGDATFPADVSPNGSFVVNGPNGKGIPPGKYVLNLNFTLASTDPAALARAEEINKQLAAINGKEIEVSSEANQKITIDIASGTVGK